MNILQWIRAARRIVATHDAEMREVLERAKRAERRAEAAEAVIRERTTIGVSVGFRAPSHIVVVGRYKGADYVEAFSVHKDAELHSIVDRLREMERYGAVRYADAPPEFRAVMKRERKM